MLDQPKQLRDVLPGEIFVHDHPGQGFRMMEDLGHSGWGRNRYRAIRYHVSVSRDIHSLGLEVFLNQDPDVWVTVIRDLGPSISC